MVKPGTSQEKMVVAEDGSLVVYLRAKAHDGEANKALMKVLAEHFGVAKSRIKIVRGQSSRQKVIEVV